MVTDQTWREQQQAIDVLRIRVALLEAALAGMLERTIPLIEDRRRAEALLPNWRARGRCSYWGHWGQSEIDAALTHGAVEGRIDVLWKKTELVFPNESAYSAWRSEQVALNPDRWEHGGRNGVDGISEAPAQVEGLQEVLPVAGPEQDGIHEGSCGG